MTTKLDFDISFEVNRKTGNILAAYFQVRKGRVTQTKAFSHGNVYADYDRSGRLLGIEMIAPCRMSVLSRIAAPEPAVKRFLKQSTPRELILA